MRGATGIIVVIVICLAAGALYYFIGRNQFQKQITSISGEVDNLKAELAEIGRMEGEIPALLAKLPMWQRQYELFRLAIPSKVDDHRFLSALVEQLNAVGAKFVGSELALGGLWLDGVSETQFEQLKTAGLDVDTAKQIKVAFYTVSVAGDYANVLNAFEGVKRYGRLYTIEQVLGPAGGAAGAVVQNSDTLTTPIEMTGRIYYGIPEGYFNLAAIQRLFAEKGTGMAARHTAEGIKSAGQQLKPTNSRSNTSAPAETPTQETATGNGLTAATGEAG